MIAAGVAAALLVGLTAWTLVDRLTGNGQSVATPSPAVSAPLDSYFVLRVAGLQQTLRDHGYSVVTTGMLDPVTRSAAADFIQVDGARPLDPWLATALRGTVITGRRDPAAWNDRFGTDRSTQTVERPLTGAGGQLDLYGNRTG